MDMSGELDELRAQNEASSISDADERKIGLVDIYTIMTINSRLSIPQIFFEGTWIPEPSTLCLRHMKPGDDPLALAWATEYLSANIASFWAESDTDPGFLRAFPAHWAEADGGVDMIEHIIEQQKVALGGLANQDYIPNPIRGNRLIPCEAARAMLEDRWMEALMDPTTIAELKPRELQQLMYICIAMDPPMGFHPTDDEEYGNDLDDWSLALFKRYLRTSGFASLPDVRDTNLSSVRRAMKELLGVLISTSKRNP